MTFYREMALGAVVDSCFSPHREFVWHASAWPRSNLFRLFANSQSLVPRIQPQLQHFAGILENRVVY